MDLYIPRKCSATNRLITSKDHASVQINVGHLDELGRYTGTFSTFALCGFVRAQGDADSALDRLWQKKKAEVRQQYLFRCGFFVAEGVQVPFLMFPLPEPSVAVLQHQPVNSRRQSEAFSLQQPEFCTLEVYEFSFEQKFH
ncbi:hypothetical protein V6N12_075345 [Hibiscus sabdariffa]|uniref:40S ribosomal protein S21 n=1 Tax=Hibiscus sabdariffa TaxID=183260 RepID=A0ABR2C7A8_9ROSI